MTQNKAAGLVCAFALTALTACNEHRPRPPASASGVRKADVKVKTGSDGLTVEQRNIGARLKDDNKPGAIKHLYAISAFTGDVILYSPVKGKVTSGSKRLTPKTVVTTRGCNSNNVYGAFDVSIGGHQYKTAEVLGDDGTYGSSSPYIFWFTPDGVQRQLMTSGGLTVLISSSPIRTMKAKQEIAVIERKRDPLTKAKSKKQ